MATATASSSNKGPLVDPALCRCCRSIKKCRLLTFEYDWSGKKEVYTDMFMDCYGLILSHLDGESKEACICATCVVRLREACAFRHQVLQSEQMFLDAKLGKDDLSLTVDVEIKQEASDDGGGHLDDGGGHVDDDDSDDEKPLIEALPQLGLARVKEECKSERETRRAAREGGKNLMNSMKQLKVKMDRMLEKPAKKKKLEKERVLSSTPAGEREHAAYRNSVAIVHHSYVCPFHNRVSMYYCYYCRDQFTNPAELREHTLTHDPKQFEDMMEGKRIPKIDITRIDCRLCDEKINDLDAFKKHLSSVHRKTIYPVTNEFLKFKLTIDSLTCTECNGVFPYFDVLKKHMVEHFGTYICDVCGACFLEQNSLRTHIKTHTRVVTYFTCEICGKNLKSKYSRYLHVATVHEKKPTVNCYKCDASFLSYALRNKHLIEVHGDKRTFPCKLCDKVYNRRKTLMEHNRRTHLKVYRHQCDLCEQRFYLPSRLKEHMATHTGERNFRCEFCDKSYHRLQPLQEHIRCHSNDRRFKCEVCSSTFTQNGSLKNHMKTHHQFELGEYQ